ncbi:hypothetical protein [Stappia indica]|uniref:Uncharacterized protein n=1 Tax=Stappia indica TaxID=538381 RepID=A0A285SKS7_9HYPH|nr:hypothetical protein [Stappia indica]MCC4245168.1 hypothetical protein [Stappia indica]SOC06753.1 hypothetical protein SAMN05421512_105194 [Stappia indica]
MTTVNEGNRMDEDQKRRTEPIEVAPGRARQGTGSPRILILLVVSLVLALIAWWGLDIYREAALAPDEPAAEATSGGERYEPSSPVLPDETLRREPEGATE